MPGITNVVIAKSKPHPWTTSSQGFVLAPVTGTIFCLAANGATQIKQVQKWKNGMNNKSIFRLKGTAGFKPGSTKK